MTAQAANTFNPGSARALSPPLAASVLERLEVAPGPAGAEHLHAILTSYASRVPWESASRIARRRQFSTEVECARWPEIFWQQHLDLGVGGTCFESNYALGALLEGIGYDVRLTVNDMLEQRACHTALIVNLAEGAFIVDVGIPIHAPVPIDPGRSTIASSAFHEYTLAPQGGRRYELTRDRHPQPYIYTLDDRDVSDAEYREALVRDYDRTQGLFLDRIIVNKVIDGVQHRFCSSDRPFCIETFSNGARQSAPLGREPARAVGKVFGIDSTILLAAWPDK